MLSHLLRFDRNGAGALTTEWDPDDRHALGQQQVVPLVAREGGTGQAVSQVAGATSSEGGNDRGKQTIDLDFGWANVQKDMLPWIDNLSSFNFV